MVANDRSCTGTDTGVNPVGAALRVNSRRQNYIYCLDRLSVRHILKQRPEGAAQSGRSSFSRGKCNAMPSTYWKGKHLEMLSNLESHPIPFHRLNETVK